MKRDPFTLRVQAAAFVAAGLLLLSAAQNTLRAYLLSQNAEPAIPVNLVGLALGALVSVGLGSFLLGVSKGGDPRD